MKKKTKKILIGSLILIVIAYFFLNWQKYKEIEKSCKIKCEYDKTAELWKVRTGIFTDKKFPKQEQCLSYCITTHDENNENIYLFINLFHQ